MLKEFNIAERGTGSRLTRQRRPNYRERAHQRLGQHASRRDGRNNHVNIERWRPRRSSFCVTARRPMPTRSAARDSAARSRWLNNIWARTPAMRSSRTTPSMRSSPSRCTPSNWPRPRRRAGDCRCVPTPPCPSTRSTTIPRIRTAILRSCSTPAPRKR
jgi:hypothetical protein